MLWRRALSEGDHSPEELMLQRRLAKKRGEILEESQQASNSSTELLPPLDFKQAEISTNSPDSTPLNSSKIQLSSKGSSLKTSPSPQNQTHRQQRNHHEHGHELGHHNENGHHSEHELPPLGQLKTDVTMSPSQATTYFGAPARDQFFQRYQWLSRQHSLQSSPNKSKNDEKSAPIMFDDPQNSVENEFKSHVEYKLRPVTPDVINLTKGFGLSSPTSPRSKYIYECIMSHINPRPSLLIRKKISNELRLEHYGMGDSMAIRLSTVLADLPMVTVLNFADNHLTDVGLTPLINRIVVMPNLVELNLSENAIGPLAAEALGKYLSRRPTIPLRRLLLSKSNVDDFEGEKFVRALVGNSTIVELDLSHNLLGHAELLNVVRPNFITAAEAMAQLLRSETCRLEQLKLSWNMIRLESAIQLSQSLSSNQSLTYLDLSYNGIGQDGGLAIGNSLLENRTLETLLLANNNINASACFTIAIGLEMNLALRRVCLDGNPIADQGAQALMNVPAAVGSRTEISAQGCNIEILDESCWFDQKNPCGSFSLNLSNPFERAISFKILNIVANHATYTLKKCVYEEMPSKKQRKKKTHVINLSQGVVQDKIRHLNAAERDVIKNLHKLKESANNHERALSLFRQYDKDCSGEIDKNELAALLEDIGIELSNKQLEDVFALYDIDNGGTIEMDEFSHFLQQQSLEASSRIRDLTESLVMVVDTGDEDDDENEIQPYYPPKTGTLKLEVVDSYTKKNRYRVISSSETHMATAVAKKIGNLAILLPYSFQHVKLRLEEAYTAYISMYGETGDKFSVLTKILPQMSSPAEARILLSKVTNDDQSEIRRLRFGLRSFRRPAFGLENGYYNLDLSLSIDRICLSKLLELSKSFHLQRSSSTWNETSLRFGDTSQENNNSCFRNERLNGAPVKISPDSFTPIPKNGRLEFDFSSISQPESGICLSDTKCLKLLVLMGLIPSNQKGRNKKRLENWSKNNNFERVCSEEQSRVE